MRNPQEEADRKAKKSDLPQVQPSPERHEAFEPTKTYVRGPSYTKRPLTFLSPPLRVDVSGSGGFPAVTMGIRWENPQDEAGDLLYCDNLPWMAEGRITRWYGFCCRALPLFSVRARCMSDNGGYHPVSLLPVIRVKPRG